MPKGDREILKADIEDGYGKISNLILEALALAKLNGVQKGICFFLFRRTYCWNKAEDEISLSEFARACGTSRAYISKQIAILLDGSIILRTSYDPGKTPAYTFNTRVGEWNKGCIDALGLHERINEGLYKCATHQLCVDGLYNRATVIQSYNPSIHGLLPGLHECATVNQGEPFGTSTSDGILKKDLKERSKRVKDGAPKAPPKFSEQAKEVSGYLKAILQKNGIFIARDWHIKAYSSAEALLKQVTKDEILACIEWVRGDPYWSKQLDSMATIERALPKYQARTRRGPPAQPAAFVGRAKTDDELRMDDLIREIEGGR